MVGDPVALPVLLDAGDGVLPDALPLDGGGLLAELAQPAGPLQLDRTNVDAATPRQLSGACPMGAEEVGVPLPPCLVLLLGAAGLPLAVGGPVGLLPGQDSAVWAKARRSRAWISSRWRSSRPGPAEIAEDGRRVSLLSQPA
jgi:hypothetical protein